MTYRHKCTLLATEPLAYWFIIDPTQIVIASEAKQSLLAGGLMLKRLPRRFLRSLLAMTENVVLLSEQKLASI
jgi:hypothetical protein